MDFMKVLDQTVREIQREVNKKVLKVPEIEQKVLDATSNEPWGPHGSDLAELAHSTRNFTESQMIMNVLWTRLSETGRNWRHVYKALAVIEYLISHGADLVVDDIIEHSYKIAATTDFEYVEPNGKDMGINVRKKSQTILALLSDKDKIQEVRRKAAANKEKYVGLSSSGMSYKSSSAAYGGGGFSSSDSSRSHDVSKEDRFDTYKSKEKNWADNDQKTSDRDNIDKDDKYASSSLKSEGKSAAKRSPQYGRSKDAASPDSGGTKKLQFKKSKEPQKDDNHDFDDFDPRGSSNASKPENTDDFDPRGSSNPGSTTTTSQKANLISPNLIDDFIDFPANVPEESSKTSSSAFPANDLFADASFVSAAPVSEMSNSHAQVEVDLFANLPATQAPFSPEVDLFSKAEPSVLSKMDNSNLRSSDPFASVQLNNFDSADLFGAFTSSTVSQGMEHEQNSTLEGMRNQNLSAAKDSKPPNKKDPFMVKSGVWADSLSRGLIDLNISAPKKTSLKDIGIVGDLTDASEPRRDEKEWFLPTSMQMGKAMGTGSGLGRPGYPPSASGDNTGFSNTSDDFGSFKF